MIAYQSYLCWDSYAIIGSTAVSLEMFLQGSYEISLEDCSDRTAESHSLEVRLNDENER